MTVPDNVDYLKPRVNLFSSSECVHYNCIFKEDLQIAKKIKFIIQKCLEIVFLILCLSLNPRAKYKVSQLSFMITCPNFNRKFIKYAAWTNHTYYQITTTMLGGKKKTSPTDCGLALQGSSIFLGCHSLRGKCVGEHTHTHTHTQTHQATNNQLVEKFLKGERKDN